MVLSYPSYQLVSGESETDDERAAWQKGQKQVTLLAVIVFLVIIPTVEEEDLYHEEHDWLIHTRTHSYTLVHTRTHYTAHVPDCTTATGEERVLAFRFVSLDLCAARGAVRASERRAAPGTVAPFVENGILWYGSDVHGLPGRRMR